MAQQKTQGKDQGKTSLAKLVVTYAKCNLISICYQQTQTTSSGHLRSEKSLIQEEKTNGCFKFTCKVP